MTPADHDLARLLAGTDIDTPDPRFVERTHRVIAVEALARLETTNARKACVRDLVFAAALVGFLVERFALDRRPLGTVLAMLAGSAVIYALGLLWLGMVTGLSGQPFLGGDALKLGLAALLLPGAWALAGRR